MAERRTCRRPEYFAPFSPRKLMEQNQRMDPTPRAAATVIAVRQRGGPPELLFVKRPKAMRFLAGFHAFPGGAVHAEDEDPQILGRLDLSIKEMSTSLGESAGSSSAGLFVCAVRELFEEVGVLLAKARAQPSPAEMANRRADLVAGRATFLELAEEWDLVVNASRLRFLARWVAPSALPVRFDARFFVTEYDGQVHPHEAEVEIAEWMTAHRALSLSEAGEVLLAPPTVATLNTIARADDVAELMSGKLEVSKGVLERLSPMVRRMVAPNSSMMTGPGTNTYIVGNHVVVVIDPGSMERSHLEAIAACGKVTKILVTHRHGDHLSGALDLSDMTGAPVAASEELWRLAGLGAGEALADGDQVLFSGGSLTALKTPGHCSDHLAFWLEAERALFAGDLVLGEGTTVISPPDGNLADYLASLEKVKRLAPDRIYPGHFRERDDATALIDWYVEHRLSRHEQILQSIRDGARSASEVVATVYADTPMELHPVAERSVEAHIDLLLEQGAITRLGDGSVTAANRTG